MTFMDKVRKGWRQLGNSRTTEEKRQHLLEDLCALYYAEAQDAAQFGAHAHRMYYPQFRDRLLRIAAEEEAHVAWLGQQICALGGNVPQPTVNPHLGHNSWECLSLDVAKERESCTQLVRRMPIAASYDPALAEGLQRFYADEQRHHEELFDMWMKSDPYTPPTPKARHPQLDQQKQAWFDQQKSEWFARERADWEATGRLVDRAEWEGELEKRWTVNELPNRELTWKRRVAEEELAHEEHALRQSFDDRGAVVTSRQGGKL